MLQRAQQVAREREDGGNDPGRPLHRLLQPFAVDPVADPVGQIAHDAGVVDVADGRMVQLAERFGLAQEPGADG